MVGVRCEHASERGKRAFRIINNHSASEVERVASELSMCSVKGTNPLPPSVVTVLTCHACLGRSKRGH